MTSIIFLRLMSNATLFRTSLYVPVALILVLLHGTHLPCQGQRRSLNRYRGVEMLEHIKDDLKEYYYDPKFKGLDLDARFKAAAEKIKEAQSNGQIYAIIAQALSELNDSHTLFLPPSWQLKVDYGFKMQHIGDGCYVTSVDPDSDASQQGLQTGDLIVAIDGFKPSRENVRKIRYSYFTLQPRDGMTLEVRGGNDQVRTLRLKMKFISGQQLERENKKVVPLLRPRYYEVNSNIVVCKLPHFSFSNDEIDTMMKNVAGRSTLILDLRGNPGGLVTTTQHFTGYFFKEEIAIQERKDRKGTGLVFSKSHGARTFNGQLLVIIDSGSASAAEIFARTIQLRKRGIVIGDRSAGAVMVSQTVVHRFDRPPTDSWFLMYYGASITVADVIMPDKQSLEHIGVTPDVIVLPAKQDLVAGTDSVLAHAVKLAGGYLDPAKAGEAFQTRN